jgi:LL-diaminopimelate aminotransferase
MKLNENFTNLNKNYLFLKISKKIQEFEKENQDKDIIKLGIGDVTLPLCDAAIEAMHKALLEMGKQETFRGYGPEGGYDFLKQGVQWYYQKRDVALDLDEIFISDGAKNDVANILDIFGSNNVSLIPDPVYPVYLDTNIMSGNKILYLQANAGNNFLPMPDETITADIIYLCSPNNPTGAVYDSIGLKKWIDYAIKMEAVILFDAAYEAFISEEGLPHSIFEIENAKKCAIEFCSLSKTAGFTGTRCSYTVIPKELEFSGKSLNDFWLRRQTTKFNGVPYIIQRGAEAIFTEKGQKQVNENIAYYKENADFIIQALKELDIWFTGGKNSPYVWMKTPKNLTSWEFFDLLLSEAGVVGTPGLGFGANGEGFFRLTAFGNKDDTAEAVLRLRNCVVNFK